MSWYKCKNSVFCVFFLLCFFIGTICGTFIFRIIFHLNESWIVAYCTDLYSDREVGFLSLLACFLRPMALAAVFGSFSFGRRLIPALIVFRGCGISYFLSAAFCAGCYILPFLVTELMILTAFFCVCRYIYFSSGIDGVIPVLNWHLVLFVLASAACTVFVQYCLL